MKSESEPSIVKFMYAGYSSIKPEIKFQFLFEGKNVYRTSVIGHALRMPKIWEFSISLN